MPIKRHDHPGVGHTEKDILNAKTQSLGTKFECAMDKNSQMYSLLKKEKKKKNEPHKPKVSISMLATDNALIEIPLES